MSPMSLACRATQQALPRLADDGLDRVRAAHLGRCLRCQAEAARYRSLSRRLAGLARWEEDAPPHLAAGVLARLDTAPVAAERVVSKAAVALAGAAAAALGTALVIAYRHRAVVH